MFVVYVSGHRPPRVPSTDLEPDPQTLESHPVTHKVNLTIGSTAAHRKQLFTWARCSAGQAASSWALLPPPMSRAPQEVGAVGRPALHTLPGAVCKERVGLVVYTVSTLATAPLGQSGQPPLPPAYPAPASPHGGCLPWLHGRHHGPASPRASGRATWVRGLCYWQISVSHMRGRRPDSSPAQSQRDQSGSSWPLVLCPDAIREWEAGMQLR